MRVIPVIDVLRREVVHAVRGQRSQYKPLNSPLTKSSAPDVVAEKFQELGFTDLYLADLDAIIECSSSFETITQITKQSSLNLWVDAGITNLERAQKLLGSGASKLIIGTETLQTKHFVEQAVQMFGSERVAISLDLKGDKMLVKLGFDSCKSPFCLLQDFKHMGVLQVIVLDLLRVGSGEGVNLAFLKKIVDKVGLEVIAGGGVRNIVDLVELKNIGVTGALVATALHNGKITIDQLKQKGFL